MRWGDLPAAIQEMSEGPGRLPRTSPPAEAGGWKDAKPPSEAAEGMLGAKRKPHRALCPRHLGNLAKATAHRAGDRASDFRRHREEVRPAELRPACDRRNSRSSSRPPPHSSRFVCGTRGGRGQRRVISFGESRDQEIVSLADRIFRFHRGGAGCVGGRELCPEAEGASLRGHNRARAGAWLSSANQPPQEALRPSSPRLQPGVPRPFGPRSSMGCEARHCSRAAGGWYGGREPPVQRSRAAAERPQKRGTGTRWSRAAAERPRQEQGLAQIRQGARRHHPFARTRRRRVRYFIPLTS